MASNYQETQAAGIMATLACVSGLISATSENSQQAKCANRLISGMAFYWLDPEESDMSSALVLAV